jgi:CRP-like cAMP-binding protein
LFLEVVTLRSGKSFGELALIKNKPRAASIKCLEDCHFAVMNKSDYQKVLSRIEQKNLNKIIDFLHSLPYLRPWTRTALGKL